MADSKGIEEIVNQVDIQAAMVIIKEFRDTDTGSWPATTPNQ